MRTSLHNYRSKTVVVSPIIGAKAFSGPTVKLMRAMQVEPSAIGLTEYYQDYAAVIIFDPSDREHANAISDRGIEPVFLDISMQTAEQKKALAQNILDIL